MQVLNETDDTATAKLQGLIPAHLAARDRAACQFVIDAFTGNP